MTIHVLDTISLERKLIFEIVSSEELVTLSLEMKMNQNHTTVPFPFWYFSCFHLIFLRVSDATRKLNWQSTSLTKSEKIKYKIKYTFFLSFYGIYWVLLGFWGSFLLECFSFRQASKLAWLDSAVWTWKRWVRLEELTARTLT